MKQPLFVIDENQKTLGADPLLIVDKEGTLGAALYEKIKKELLVILVGGQEPIATTNLVYLPYKKRFPRIPDGVYFVTIHVMTEEREIKDSILPLLKKAKGDKRKFVLIMPYHMYRRELVEKIITGFEQSMVIVIGDLFGNSNTPSRIDSYIQEAVLTNRIYVEGMGLKKVYPVLFDDAVYAILQTIFGIHQEKKIVCVLPQHPVSVLSIVHKLQKIEPLIHVDFIKEKKVKTTREETLQKPEGTYVLEQNYSVYEKIADVYKKLISLQKAQKETALVDSDVVPVRKHNEYGRRVEKRQKVFTGIIAVIYFFFIMTILPLFSLLLFAFVGQKMLFSAKAALEKGTSTHAYSYAKIADLSFGIAGNAADIFLLEAHVIGKQQLAEALSEKVSTGEKLSHAMVELLDAIQDFRTVFGGETKNSQQEFTHGIDSLRQAIVDFELVKTQTNVINSTSLQKIEKPLQLVSNTLDTFPKLLGFAGKRTYLVLFQNNMELRPGGGFIGSYGLVMLDKGKIVDFAIHDVYDADGQLRVRVEPPFAIRRYLPLGYLYLRDSNFDVDFVRNAANVSYFLKLETGQSVDGVIGIDLFFVQSLIDALGPIYVPAYKETVTKDNFFLLTEKHAEKNTFPGSSQKKDFLAALFASIQTTVQTKKDISYLALAENVMDAITKKDLLIAVTDPSIDNIFTANKLSSSLWDGRQEKEGVINDVFGLNEANIGANKTNYFIERTIKQTVSLDGSGVLQGKVAVTYKNTSEIDKWPGGYYKNYLRIILPAQTQLTGIAINGQEQKVVPAIIDPYVYEDKGFIPPRGIEVEKTEEEGKSLFGFLVTVPSLSTQIVTISYEHTQKINLANPQLTYNLLLFKQPGTKSDLFEFSFEYPLEYRIVNASPHMVTQEGQLTSINKLATDQTIEIHLAKK